jgi:hypothetical protein
MSVYTSIRWYTRVCCFVLVYTGSYTSVIGHKCSDSDFFRISDFYFRPCPTLSDFVRLSPILSDSVQNVSQIDVGDYFPPKWTVTGLRWPRSCSRRSFWNALIRGVFTEAVYN